MKKQIRAVLESEYKGPRASYGEVDVLKAMFAIGNSPTNLGRLKLGQLVGLGQGEIRTLISRLKGSGLIYVDSRGCAFTEKGKREFDAISKAVPFSSPVQARELSLGKFAWSVLVRGRESKVRKGIEQRDASIRAGATGALTVVFSRNRFMVPSMDGSSGSSADCEAMGPSEPWVSIRNLAKPKDGDIVIVSGADTASLAEEGALAAALTLL